jgi:hypothetical protein
MSLECERCEDTENVRQVFFFAEDDPNKDPEYLCWDCRWPYIKNRTESDSESEDESADSMQQATNKTVDTDEAQAGLTDF